MSTVERNPFGRFSPDGRLLASGSFDRTPVIWDVSDIEHPRRAFLQRNADARSTQVAFWTTAPMSPVRGWPRRWVRLRQPGLGLTGALSHEEQRFSERRPYIPRTHGVQEAISRYAA